LEPFSVANLSALSIHGAVDLNSLSEPKNDSSYPKCPPLTAFSIAVASIREIVWRCSAHLPVGCAYDVQKAVKRLLFGLGSKQYDREDCDDEGSAKKTGL
jgi:hypothetical protein